MRVRVIEDLALVESGGVYNTMSQICPLILLEEKDVYPADIWAISGGGPDAIAYMLRKTKRLEPVWFEITPKKLFKRNLRELVFEPIKKCRLPILGAPGIFKIDELDRIIDREVDFEAIIESPIRLWLAVADLLSGKVLWFSNKDEGMTAEFLRNVTIGSMRMPVFFKPIRCSFRGVDYQFVDSGLSIDVPIRLAVERGFSKIIALESLPYELPRVPPLETLGEIDVRYSQMRHNGASDFQFKQVARTNRNLEILEKIEGLLSQPRIPEDIREALLREHQNYSFYSKSQISVCHLTLPANISIFQKDRKKDYGSPTREARSELLGAGEAAGELILLPFLKEHGILPPSGEGEHEEFMRMLREKGAL